MEIKREQVRSVAASARNAYTQQVELRAAVQAIPYIGSSLDTLLVGRANELRIRRIEAFVEVLRSKLESVPQIQTDLDEEALFDLMVQTFERVVRTRSEKKRSRFAQIIARQVREGHAWEKAETAVRLLGDLDGIHLEVIAAVMAAPRVHGDNAFKSLKVVSLASPDSAKERGEEPLALSAALPEYEPVALRMACAELVAKGLLHDEGIGRYDYDGGAMEYFVATDLAEWFCRWIRDQDAA